MLFRSGSSKKRKSRINNVRVSAGAGSGVLRGRGRAGGCLAWSGAWQANTSGFKNFPFLLLQAPAAVKDTFDTKRQARQRLKAA